MPIQTPDYFPASAFRRFVCPVRMEVMFSQNLRVARSVDLDYRCCMQAFDLNAAPLVEDAQGVIRVTGTRVQLETIVTAFDAGATPDEIVQSYTTLDLPAVYAIIAFVLQNRTRVDAYMAERREASEKLRREIEQRFPQTGVRERLLERRARSVSE